LGVRIPLSLNQRKKTKEAQGELCEKLQKRAAQKEILEENKAAQKEQEREKRKNEVPKSEGVKKKVGERKRSFPEKAHQRHTFGLKGQEERVETGGTTAKLFDARDEPWECPTAGEGKKTSGKREQTSRE